jgi:hypothetical protein
VCQSAEVDEGEAGEVGNRKGRGRKVKLKRTRNLNRRKGR